MNRTRCSWIAVVAACAASMPAAAGEPQYRAATGTWRLPLETPHLTGSNAVEVLLPSGYDRDPHRSHRVLYVLPVAGEGGEHGNSLEVIRSLGLHDRHDLICVAPQFARMQQQPRALTMPWYGNHATDPRMRYEDHLIKVVLPAVESRYRTIPGRAGRLLLGFSKSGWGAVCLLLGHGGTFEAAASFDAPLMFAGGQFGAWGTDQTYGTADQMEANCPTTLLRRHAADFRARPRLVIAGKKSFGTLNDRRAAHPYEGPSHTEAFHDLAGSLGVQHVYALNGPHSTLLPGFPEHSWNATWMEPVVDLLVQAVAGNEVEPRARTADVADEVVVVGATPGGIAAAVSAARGGSRVVLVEEQAHVGGVIAGGLSNIDNVRKEAIGGLFNEFKRRVVAHYVQTYGPDSPQVQDSRGGTDFEPRVAERVFGEMLAGEERIRVLLGHRLQAAHKRGSRLTDIVSVPLAGGEPVRITGRVFIDATYEGDLAAVAGVPCRIGRESRGEYGEPLAGRIYMDMATKEVLPGSTGEGDRGIQAFTYRFPLTNEPGNRVPVEKPEGYDVTDYRDLLADVAEGHVKRLRDVIQMRRAPNGKVVVNNDHMEHGHPRQSLDLAEENWDWPAGTPETRDRIRRRYWTYVEGMLWFLQHDPRVPEAVRTEAAQWGFCKDEFPDNRHRPWQIYVREARRIVGAANFTARDTEPDPATGRPRAVPDAIAMVEYGFDSHAVHTFDPAHPLAREGYLGMGHPPTQLPYGVVVPKDVDGLLVPVACSASRLGYQTIRMEPVFMALGEACGIAATTALAAGVEVRAVDVAAVQREIVARGGVIALDDSGKGGQTSQPAAKPAQSTRPRNIVFILADDHRHDLMGCVGHPFVETPGLDSLARDGVRFRNAFVTTSLCSPSRASILTGHYAHTHGVIDNTAGLRPGAVLFPELLQRAGYRTGFFGKWHIGETSDAPQPGFDRWVSFRGHGSYLPGSSRPDRPPAMLNIDGRPVPQQGYITDELTDYCLDWLAAAAKNDKPFFAYLSHKGVHGNFQPAARHVGRYRDAPLPPLVAHPERPDAESHAPLWVRNQRNSWHGIDFPYQDGVPLADLYRAQCEALLSVDESVARIRAWLAEHGLADSTMVVYMGDNGFLWGEHGLIDKRTAYEESMRVPLLGVCPGTWPAGTVRDEMVAGIDIAPTVLAAAGMVPSATMAGRSFLDLAAGRTVDPPWRDRLLYEYFWEYTFPHTPTVFALRTKTHKFVQCHGVWDLDEFYDLEVDPREQRNLVLDPAHAAAVASMRQDLAALLVQSGVTSVPFSPKRNLGNSLRLESGSGAAEFPPEWLRKAPAPPAHSQ